MKGNKRSDEANVDHSYIERMIEKTNKTLLGFTLIERLTLVTAPKAFHDKNRIYITKVIILNIKNNQK